MEIHRPHILSIIRVTKQTWIRCNVLCPKLDPEQQISFGFLDLWSSYIEPNTTIFFFLINNSVREGEFCPTCIKTFNVESRNLQHVLSIIGIPHGNQVLAYCRNLYYYWWRNFPWKWFAGGKITRNCRERERDAQMVITVLWTRDTFPSFLTDRVKREAYRCRHSKAE